MFMQIWHKKGKKQRKDLGQKQRAGFSLLVGATGVEMKCDVTHIIGVGVGGVVRLNTLSDRLSPLSIMSNLPSCC